jgi:2-keto-4-pentenoate hydratase/2-oxohepta-3-ene-1,7-dioic acid hydratase in catechol pathway
VKIYRYLPASGDEPQSAVAGHEARVAIAVDGGPPVDLLDAWRVREDELPDGDFGAALRSPLALIEKGPAVWSEVRDVVSSAGNLPDILVEGARLLAPLDQVPSLRDFLAFEDHVLRGAERRHSSVPEYWYEAPIYYKGNHRSIIGPDTECPWPSYTHRLDFELELAMIAGRKGKDIPAEAADPYVFGFTILDDFSARDIQAREMTAWLGPAKGKDFATALGPCIVTADEVGAEPDLEMICRVNGEEWGRSRSGKARWKWADMIAHVSQAEEIWPGDVYGSGTPGGCCGLDLGRELQPGDVVELEIEAIGCLRNTVGPRPS